MQNIPTVQKRWTVTFTEGNGFSTVLQFNEIVDIKSVENLNSIFFEFHLKNGKVLSDNYAIDIDALDDEIESGPDWNMLEKIQCKADQGIELEIKYNLG
jgi:hypothetical protein